MNTKSLEDQLPKEYRRYLNDIKNWMVHDSQTEREIRDKLFKKGVPNDAIDVLLEFGKIELIRSSRKKALIYIVTGFALFIIGFLLNFGMALSAGRGFALFAIIGFTGLFSMIRGIYFYVKLLRTKDSVDSRELSEKLGSI